MSHDKLDELKRIHRHGMIWLGVGVGVGIGLGSMLGKAGYDGVAFYLGGILTLVFGIMIVSFGNTAYYLRDELKRNADAADSRTDT